MPEGYDGGEVNDHAAWKVIKAAVCGHSEGDAKVDGYCEPESLFKAAVAFQKAADILQRSHTIFDKSAKSIAGPDRVWQGTAADAFLERMTAHAKVMEKLYQSITGWPGKMGSTDPDGGKNSMVTALVDAANKLDSAQKTLNAIDVFHAQQAVTAGAGNNSDGTVTVSSRPEIVALLNDDMGKVFSALQQDYKNTQTKIRTASGALDPVSQPNSNDPSFDPSGWNDKQYKAADELGDSDGFGLGDDSEFGPTPWDGSGSGSPGSFDPSSTNSGTGFDPSSFTGGGAPTGWDAGSFGSGTPANWSSGGTPTGWDAGSFDSGTPANWSSGNSSLPAWDPSTVSTGASTYDPYSSSGSGAGYSGTNGTGSYGSGAGSFGTGSSGGLGTSGIGSGRAGGAGGMAGGMAGYGAGLPGGMMPGMGGAGGQGEQERERSTWLVEDEKVWGADPNLPPDVIGRS
ncbi:hypothetical protein [Actinoplanes derwentensis]|uniref:hypothetical protein n=1 Tax=Actinoplanes derwentensis TaxID=113562 RepID=UPI0012FE66B4|nr:hypothetical protein [Actinoplanes derwentensis]